MGGERILVLGASGMLGHELIRVLGSDLEVWGACRDPGSLPNLSIPQERLLGGLDARDHQAGYGLLERVRPTHVINAVGIVKQRPDATAAIPSIAVNSLWPHIVADASARVGARLVHVSTDCVFTGARGHYTEDDTPDATDLYGRSKLLGEVSDSPNAVTLRTSIIGWQISGETSLLNWFASHHNEPLLGYTRAIFSGLSSRALSELIRDVVIPNQTLTGLWHVSADPIDKHTLLTELARHLAWNVSITPVAEPAIDRSLDSTRFRNRTGWTPPAWDDMLQGLADEYADACSH